MKILLDHTAHHNNFLLSTLWNLSWFTMTLQQKQSLRETVLPEFCIYDPNVDSNIFDEIDKAIPELPFKVLDQSERDSVFQDMKSPIVHFESTMILPRLMYYTNFELPDHFKNRNVCLPLITYKYNYKTVNVNGKDFRVKNFIRSTEPFFENAFVPDWDERFYITHALLAKLGEDPPLMSPSPLLHEWGSKVRLIKNNNHEGDFDPEKDVVISKMSYVVHKFERVADDSI